MPPQIKAYSDLDLSFIPHPIKGDIVPLTGADAVKRSVRNLCLTNFYEWAYLPSQGSGITASLFENIDPITALDLRTNIINLLARYEPRAENVVVLITDDSNNNQILVTIQFSIATQTEPVTVRLFLERVR